MKKKLGIILLLLLVLNLEGLALSRATNSKLAFNPDGNPVAGQRRKKRRQRHSRPRPKMERTSDTSGGGGRPSAADPSAEPSEQPTMAAPPPVQARPDMNMPGRGAPSKKSSAPKIKPPTVQIKPPTR